MSKDKLTIAVSKEVYDLAKAGKINSIMLDPEKDFAKRVLKREDQEVGLYDRDKASGTIRRRIVLVDHVNQGYLGKGYPPEYRTRKRMTRVMIDMVIPEAEPEKPKEAVSKDVKKNEPETAKA